MMDRVSSPADLPESTLADLFLDASDRHAGSLAYRYFADSGDDLTDLGFESSHFLFGAFVFLLNTALGCTKVRGRISEGHEFMFQVWDVF